MLKRLLCVIFSVLLALTACVCASASDIETRATAKAPDGLRFVFTYPNEGSECIEAVISVPDDMCAVAAEMLRQDPNMDRVTVTHAGCIQFDWSIDSRDAFHYDESWDKPGGDYPIQQLNGSFVEKKEVFWFAYPQSAERCAGALKETEKDGATVRTFDFDAHKLYVRARFMVYLYATQKCFFSDWSDVCDVGADKNAAAPQITGTGKDCPAFTGAQFENGALHSYVKYPDSIHETAKALLAGYGTQLSFESQIRVDGGEWMYWTTENDSMPYLTERATGIAEFKNGETIEYRCRLIGHDPSNGNAIITGWSDYATVRDGKAEVVKNDDPFDKKAEAQRQKDAEREANKCKVCGICPFHPFGVCMFIWLGILLLVVAVIAYNIVSVNKKKKRAAEVKAREEASRRSSSDKTESFVLTDRITLQKKEETPADAPQEEETNEN